LTDLSWPPFVMSNVPLSASVGQQYCNKVFPLWPESFLPQTLCLYSKGDLTLCFSFVAFCVLKEFRQMQTGRYPKLN